MSQDVKDSLTRLEAETQALATAVNSQGELLRLTNQRLDEILALLTPKESDETGLSDLLATLVMIGREQLTLAQHSLKLLASIDERLPHGPEDADEIAPRAGGRPL